MYNKDNYFEDTFGIFKEIPHTWVENIFRVMMMRKKTTVACSVVCHSYNAQIKKEEEITIISPSFF